VRRDRASYGVDGGYGGIAVFVLAVGGPLAGERWASRRGKRQAKNVPGRCAKPSGSFAPAGGRVVDERADRYAPVLQGAGCVDVEVRRLDWRTWSGLPGHHFTLVSARKPAAGSGG
jgi:hypothetical protein